MKKFVIHTQDGVAPELKLAAKEAAEEFLSVFPEYKNSFKIEFRDDANIQGKEISQAEFDALPDGPEKQSFRKSSRGTWLVPYKSMEWFLKQATQNMQADERDVRALTSLQNDKRKDDEFIISLVNGTLVSKNPNGQREVNFAYGYTLGNCFTLSATACDNDKEMLKTIFMHEMGHIFDATRDNRANTTHDDRLGTHCTNDLCIMGPSNYPELNRERLRRKARGKPPFCNECIESMREYLSHMPGITKEIILDEFEESLPVLPHNNREWKKEFREFYKTVAARDGDEYKEDLSKANYVAHIKRPDGSRLEVEANNEYHVALGAVDKEGHNDIPSLKDMDDFVKLAQSKNSNVCFGKDNEPEFNARLMIACLEFKPQPATMSHKPEINKEFLDQLEPETKQHLQRLLHPQPQNAQTLVIGNANSGISM